MSPKSNASRSKLNDCEAVTRFLTCRHRKIGKSLPNGERANLSLGWIMLGVVGWLLGLLFVLVLMRMASDQDRAARHEQKRIDPDSDVTITRPGVA